MLKIIAKSVMFSPLVFGLLSVTNKVTLAAVKCSVNGREVPCEGLGKGVGVFLGWGMLGFLVIFSALGILATVFWIMMIVHAAKNDVENKAMWIILMVFTGMAGALIYYFTVKRKLNKQFPPSTPIMTQ